MDTFLSSLSKLSMNILSYTVLYTILYTLLYTILESLLYTVLYTILYIMLYKEIKVICLFSQEHYPSYLLCNVLQTTIYTVLNTLLCIVLYSTLFKNIKVPRKTSLFIGVFFLPVFNIEHYTV